MGLANRLRKKNKPRHTNPDAGKQFHAASAAELIELDKATDGLIGRTMDDFFAMAKIALNRAFGFGQIRWNRIHRKMLLDLTCIGERYVTVKEINQALREEADFGFNAPDRKHWTYERKVAATVCDDMSSCFALALLDEFGFKAKRIAKAYDMMGQIGNDLKTGKLSRKEFVRLALGEKMTNFDVMRNGAPEEIAKLIDEQIVNDVCDMFACDECAHATDRNWKCWRCWFDWLNREVAE